ncbi:MAG: hypothetical protein QNM02_21420 [Acidimicrobiia bacterium]|nr:hypothetical protein [Acidimicrobiia bacterium]
MPDCSGWVESIENQACAAARPERSTSSHVRLLLIGLLVTLASPLLRSTTAQAHSGNQSDVYLEVFDTATAGRVEYPIRDLNRVLGLDIPAGESETLAELEANAETIQSDTREHTELGPVDGG